MIKRLILVISILVGQFSIFANTGWSGKVTDDSVLDQFVIDSIQQMYLEQCHKTKLKSLYMLPVVEVTRVNDESDYLGSRVPTYTVEVRVYDRRVFDFVSQNITVEVHYNQLSQELNLSILDEELLECRN